MITKTDIITYPYTPDLTQAGITYACQSLRYGDKNIEHASIRYLQQIVAGVAVEIAFRRYLTLENVPHTNLNLAPFTNPDRYNIAIGGRRCEIKNALLVNKNRIKAVNKDSTTLLQVEAIIPVDQMKKSQLLDDDIYIFIFLTALLTTDPISLAQAQQASQPIYLIHVLPKAWAIPDQWVSLGKIALKSNATKPINIQLGGQGKDQSPLQENLLLMHKNRISLEKDFYSLQYLHTPDFPDDTLGIHSPRLNDTYLIDSAQWGNIWVYGMNVIFMGYITRGEFRRQGKIISSGNRDFHNKSVPTQNLAIPMNQLHPLHDLFTRAKNWRKTRNQGK